MSVFTEFTRFRICATAFALAAVTFAVGQQSATAAPPAIRATYQAVANGVVTVAYLASDLDRGRLTATVTSSDSSVTRVWNLDLRTRTVTVDTTERSVEVRLGPTAGETIVMLSGVTGTLAAIRSSPPIGFDRAVARTAILGRDAIVLYAIAAASGWSDLAVAAIAVSAARRDAPPPLQVGEVTVYGIIRLPCDSLLCCLDSARADYDRCLHGGSSDDECTDEYNRAVYYCTEDVHWSEQDTRDSGETATSD